MAVAGLSGRGPKAPRGHPSGMAEKARLRAPRPHRSRPGSAERQGSKPLSLRMLTFAALWCAQYVIGDYNRCANQVDRMKTRMRHEWAQYGLVVTSVSKVP